MKGAVLSLDTLPTHHISSVCHLRVKYLHDVDAIHNYTTQLKSLHVQHSLHGNELWYWISNQRWPRLKSLHLPMGYEFAFDRQNFPVLVDFTIGGLPPKFYQVTFCPVFKIERGFFGNMKRLIMENQYRDRLTAVTYLSCYRNPFPKDIALKIARCAYRIFEIPAFHERDDWWKIQKLVDSKLDAQSIERYAKRMFISAQ